MRRLVSITLIVYLACQLGCNPRPAPPADQASSPQNPVVRVRLLESQPSVSIRAAQPPVIRVGTNPVNVALPSAAVTITCDAAGWKVGGQAVGNGELTIQPAAVGTVAVNGAAYRGQLRFVAAGAGKFDVINDVLIDDYLKGVVAKEMLADWHPEAYKAQAVVARTYALYERETVPQGRSWDLYPDQRSQVYGGLAGETPKAVASVEATRGVVVAYEDQGATRLVKTYFSSCCGGAGQNPAEGINEPYHPALEGQNVGDLCKASPRFNWGPITITRTELTRRVKLWGKRNGRSEERITRVMAVHKTHQNRAGRPVRYTLVDVSGTRYSLSGEELRWAINTDAPKDSTVYSSWIEPAEPANESITFRGRGFGHGIGLCQWCTQTRALKGVSWEEMVRVSYPGAVLMQKWY